MKFKSEDIYYLDEYEVEAIKLNDKLCPPDKVKQQLLSNQDDATLGRQLVKILSNHCGEDGDNEGAVETFERIIKKAEKWDNLDKEWVEGKTWGQLLEENKRLKEIVEKIKRLPIGADYQTTRKEIKELLATKEGKS